MANLITDRVHELDNDELIQRREVLMDFFTPNANNTAELNTLLEIERELTKRET